MPVTEPLHAGSKPVSVAAVRDELEALWASEAVDGQAVFRARTHNLVVYAPSDLASIDDITRQVIALTEARPGRVIVIHDDCGSDSNLEAWPNIYCHAQGSHQVCGESIVLSVGGRQRDELHSTVVSLLVSDLPVSLWWMAQPAGADHLFDELIGDVDQLIVDSDAFPDQVAGLHTLHDMNHPHLADLSWERLLPWRRFLAQLWDEAELREPLRHIRTLDVMVNTSGDFLNLSRALLLVGWLSDRLGWQLESALKGPTGGYRVIWHQAAWQGKVEIVESSYDSLDLGEIACIFIQAGSQPPYVMPRIELSLEGGCVDLRVDDANPSALRRRIDYHPLDSTAALARLLDQPVDPLYRAALNNVMKILELAGP
jgi:glucose-6-phosphate dehydrogenase assembly protein OpcA